MDSYQIPWRWPWCEHLSKMKIFWKHSAIFLSHAFATKFIMNQTRSFPYKRTIACSFSRDKQKRLSRSRRMCKKRDLFRYSELIKLLSITETLLLLTPAWKMKCSEAFAALGTGVPGERRRRGGSGHPPPPHLHHMHSAPGLWTQPLLNIWGLQTP